MPLSLKFWIRKYYWLVPLCLTEYSDCPTGSGCRSAWSALTLQCWTVTVLALLGWSSESESSHDCESVTASVTDSVSLRLRLTGNLSLTWRAQPRRPLASACQWDSVSHSTTMTRSSGGSASKSWTAAQGRAPSPSYESESPAPLAPEGPARRPERKPIRTVTRTSTSVSDVHAIIRWWCNDESGSCSDVTLILTNTHY